MNILFITADQWRGECLSSAGHPHVKTPNLDALAADGVSFRKHFAQATPCGPSRACLYTGMYMQNHRSLLNGTPLDARHTNVALELRKAGYEPALFGYTDVSLDPRQYAQNNIVAGGYEGILPGMDSIVHLDAEGAPWLANLKSKGYADVPDHTYDMLTPGPLGADETGKGRTFAPAKFKAEDSSTAFLVDEAISFIADKKNASWCVHMSFLSPHPPYIAPIPYNSRYDVSDMPLPVRRDTPQEEAEQHPWLDHYIFNQRGDGYSVGALSKDNLALLDNDLRQLRATYFGMISEVDAQIGRLLDHLKRTDSYDDTLIVFTSDHGDLLGDHWMLSKFSYHDQVFHVPLIIRYPGQEADKTRGTKIENFSEIIDIMPTLLDCVGHRVPDQCDGRSLLPFLHGEQPNDWRTECHGEFDLRSPYDIDEDIPLGLTRGQCSVNVIRSERYKYVHFSGLPPLFFDLENDPDEFTNLANDPDHQGRMLEYAQKMLDWRMHHDDPALTDFHLASDGTVQKLPR